MFGYDRNGYDKDGYNRYLINREGINKETGKKDERIVIIEKWLQSRTSQGGYAAIIGMTEEAFFELIEEVIRMYPKIEEAIKLKNNRTQEIYLLKNKNYAMKIVSGKMTVEEFAKNIHSDFETGNNSWKSITLDIVTNVYSKILKD
jgi:N-glycosylase/DNA lyase